MASAFPFEKNRYFPNKRMCAADFTRELAYIDQKFALLQRWTLGWGRLFGLQVQQLDEETIMVSPGVALDGQGRYLAVSQPTLCRLESLAGLDTLEGESAVLVLSYREENKDPVDVATGQSGRKKEYAVAAESCAFSLQQAGTEESCLLDSLLIRDVLYQDAVLQVRQTVPRVISDRRPAVLRLELDNLSGKQQEVWIHYVPRLSGFALQPRKLEQQVLLPAGRTALELLLTPESPAGTAVLELRAEDFSFSVGDRVRRLAAPRRQELTVTAGDPVKVLAQRCREISMEQACTDSRDGVAVARVQLFRYKDKVLLDRVVSLPEDQEAGAPAVDRQLEACRSFFPLEQKNPPREPAPVQPVSPQPREPAPVQPVSPQPRQMATGVAILQASVHLEKDGVLRSGEIVHNLGLGTVYVEFGVEHTYPSPGYDRSCSDLLLGDPSLFEKLGAGFPAGTQRGILVHPDRGTFEIALRIPGKLPQTTIQLRWFAWRPQEQVTPAVRTSSLIGLEPSVVYTAPGESLRFTPVFTGEPLACQFFVPGRQDGFVSREGVYTAPRREGLYQVCARLQDSPRTKVGAFVIVRAREQEAGDGSGKV